jgi:radical SAM superfamily enzyme YgiQ (UPF0313 family)
LSIYATFVFGFDNDTPEVFDRTVEFALQNSFFFAAFNHVTPFPATPLFEQLREEARLLTDKWWLDKSYRYGGLPFHPRRMSHREVSQRCAQARRDFFRHSSIARRWLSLVRRDWNPILSAIFLMQNLNLQREVDQRMQLPIGTGLDELPKV